MNFFSGNKEENTHLQIAWNAATVGINPTKIRKGLLKRNTIMLYDISKSCELIGMSEREFRSLKIQAQLLCGVTKIMRQKTFFLYEDTLHLCSRLQSAMAVSPARTDHIDTHKNSFSAFNYHSITMEETDDLLMYQNSNQDVPFADLFDFSHVGGPDLFDKKLYEQDFDSVLLLTNTLSIDIPYIETEYPQMLLTDTIGSADVVSSAQSASAFQDKELFDDIDLDYGDNDIDMGDYVDDGLDFSKELSNYVEQTGVTAAPHTTSEEVFEFPNTLHVEKTISNSSGEASSKSSPRTSPSIRPIGGGPMRGYNTIKQTLPPLIAEEDEYDTSFSSINTDMYSNIVEETDNIVVSPIPPELPRPRIVRRMMLEQERDTMIPWSTYTNTERITRRNTDEQSAQQSNSKRRKLIEKELRFPSIALDINGRESTLSIMEDEKYRFYFSHQYFKERNTGIEFPRNQQIELSRHDHRQYSSSGSNSGSAVHIRSSSDVTGSVDMHNFDLSDVDMKDAEIRRFPESTFASGFNDGQFDYDNDDIDYGYFDFDDGFRNALDSSVINSTLHREQDEERRRNEFLQELYACKQHSQNSNINLSDIFQFKNRYENARSFHYLLELASNNKVIPYQNEPFGVIEIRFK